MKILKNKTYNQVLKTIEILITDKKKLSDKCDRIQIELNESNERLQKAEAERDELLSKLSRKGLGVKGKKKENCAFHYDYNTEILKKA